MTLSLERWPTKAKEAPSPHKVRLALLDTNPVFQSLRETLEQNILDKMFQQTSTLRPTLIQRRDSKFFLPNLLLQSVFMISM